MKCATVTCEAQATLRAFWPGQNRDFCVPCATRAFRVAEAMGFKLSIGRIAANPDLVEGFGDLSSFMLDLIEAAKLDAAKLCDDPLAPGEARCMLAAGHESERPHRARDGREWR